MFPMKESSKKKENQAVAKANQKDRLSNLRLIKNENWQPERKPKVRIKPLPDDTLPAA
jgi:hypothetical protein